MSSVILRSVNGRARTLTVWAGRLLAFISVWHMVFFLAQSIPFMAGWITGDLRGEEVTTLGVLSESAAFFWASLGSFAVPLFLVGLLISRLGRAGLAAPAIAHWILGGWMLIGALIYEPGGFPLGLVFIGMLIAADRIGRKESAG